METAVVCNINNELKQYVIEFLNGNNAIEIFNDNDDIIDMLLDADTNEFFNFLIFCEERFEAKIDIKKLFKEIINSRNMTLEGFVSLIADEVTSVS